MRLRSSLHLVFALALVVSASAQQSADPNHPENQGPIMPSILDHGSGTDQGNIGPFPTPTDKQFAQLSAYGAMLEIQLGHLATERGSSPAVKALGQRMVDDYTTWQAGLGRAANRLQITIPTELDARRKAVVDRLSGLTGPEFDQAYVKEELNLQNRAITVTQHEASNAGVTGFRNWAGMIMPTLHEHLRLTKAALTTSK